MNKKIIFLPTNIPERKWIIKYSIDSNILNKILNHFQNPRYIEYNGKYGPCGLSYYYKHYEWVSFTYREIWSPLMDIPDYNKDNLPKIPLESTDIYDCIYKLHDMFPQFTEYWYEIGGTKEEYLEDYFKNCKSYEILVVSVINTDLIKSDENYITSVKHVVSYLDDGEIKNVIFDKELHKIVD